MCKIMLQENLYIENQEVQKKIKINTNKRQGSMTGKVRYKDKKKVSKAKKGRANY